jgi:DNA-binding CsgD family transcriptional regulator
VAELMASLSVATDLGMGQPADYAMTTCVVAVRLGEALGFDAATLQDVYYETLLRYVGCNADTYWFASLFGDELAFRAEYKALDTADKPALVDLVRRSVRRSCVGMDEPGVEQAILRAIAELPVVRSSFLAGHCEVARRLSARMGFGASFIDAVGQIYARWDGKGVPALEGEAISPALLCACLAHDAVTFHRLGGVSAARAMAAERSGGTHAPRMVEVFRERADTLLAGLEQPPTWKEVLDLEPGVRRVLDDDALDTALEAVADFSDIKSPWFLEHSRGVAALAARAGEVFGLPASDRRLLRRAALVHDIGKVGVSAAVWGKAGPLTESEWEAVRLHPYHTERVFSRSLPLKPIGALAALHHERLDESGYHRGLPSPMLSASARLLAAANRFRALVEARPHRPALSPERAARQLRTEAGNKQLDADAVSAVLTAAGDASATAANRRAPSTSLSEREIEVLRLVARGHTMKAVGEHLHVAYKTVDRHVQNIYTKIGVNTRAGATLWAVERGLT